VRLFADGKIPGSPLVLLLLMQQNKPSKRRVQTSVLDDLLKKSWWGVCAIAFLAPFVRSEAFAAFF
jgi:hypothetical protein